MKVGVRDGEIVLRIQSERDVDVVLLMLDPHFTPVRVYGEDVTEELRDLCEQISEVEWA